MSPKGETKVRQKAETFMEIQVFTLFLDSLTTDDIFGVTDINGGQNAPVIKIICVLPTRI